MTILTAKTWKIGNNCVVITIPKNIRKLLNVDLGDYIEVEIKQVSKPKKQTNEQDVIPARKYVQRY